MRVTEEEARSTTHSSTGVTTWLKKVFGNCPIPQYKVSEQAVDILCKLAEYIEAREQDVSLVMEGLKEWSKEYKAEGNNTEDCVCLNLGECLIMWVFWSK
uniref:Uncharacterized protein n=1 Tax=Amazona collaria TaxID=241587 RepID=A0A8B9F6T7_9PSIT